MLKEIWKPLDPEFLEEEYNDIKSQAEDLLQELANEDAARGYSFHEEPNDMVIAYFGDAVAVNGDIIRDGKGEVVIYGGAPEEKS